MHNPLPIYYSVFIKKMKRNKKKYVLPYTCSQKVTPLFLLVMGLLSVSTTFLLSGLAGNMMINEILCYLSLFLFCIYAKKGNVILNNKVKAFVIFSIITMALLLLINYESNSSQLINLTSTFGIVLFVQMFSSVCWERKDLLKLGLFWGGCTIVVGYLLLPGHIFEGWNTNSISSMFPVFVISACCLWVSDVKRRFLYIGALFILFFGIASSLDNRSALIATLAFGLFMIIPPFAQKRKYFRMLYIGIILINVLLPMLNTIIGSLDVFQDLIGATSEMTESDKVGYSSFNGREELWQLSLMIQAKNPLFGQYGVRLFYPHNFSMDLLNEFGWIGYITFFVMVVSILEYSYREGSKYNVFLVGFILVIFLNTFENMFTCCGYMQFFVYCLPAIALRINQRLVIV